MTAKKKGKPTARKRSGMLPGEARRKSLVSVEVVATSEARDTFRASDLTVQEHYIVESIWLDGEMRSVVSYKGETWRLPAKVVAAMLRHRESIVKERRVLSARERSLRSQAVADQAEAERLSDSKGG